MRPRPQNPTLPGPQRGQPLRCPPPRPPPVWDAAGRFSVSAPRGREPGRAVPLLSAGVLTLSWGSPPSADAGPRGSAGPNLSVHLPAHGLAPLSLGGLSHQVQNLRSAATPSQRSEYAQEGVGAPGGCSGCPSPGSCLGPGAGPRGLCHPVLLCPVLQPLPGPWFLLGVAHVPSAPPRNPGLGPHSVWLWSSHSPMAAAGCRPHPSPPWGAAHQTAGVPVGSDPVVSARATRGHRPVTPPPSPPPCWPC